MSGTRHLSTHPGKRVRLLMRDGTSIDGWFERREEAKRYMHLLDTDGAPLKVECVKVRAMIINPRDTSS